MAVTLVAWLDACSLAGMSGRLWAYDGRMTCLPVFGACVARAAQLRRIG